MLLHFEPELKEDTAGATRGHMPIHEPSLQSVKTPVSTFQTTYESSPSCFYAAAIFNHYPDHFLFIAVAISDTSKTRKIFKMAAAARERSFSSSSVCNPRGACPGNITSKVLPVNVQIYHAWFVLVWLDPPQPTNQHQDMDIIKG
jgi:hypothetical protein